MKLTNIEILFILFFIYSFAGWLIESTGDLIKKKKFINRGFLIGPYCPIYGIGVVLITLLLSKYSEDFVALFIFSMVLCGVLEYLTSYIMEKVFKARWWDYSQKKFNINGRICLETMIPFGLIACLVIYVINPFIVETLNTIPNLILNALAIIVLIFFISDAIISFNIVNDFKKTVKKVTKEDNTEDINNYIKDKLLQKSIFYRRLIKAFPKVETKRKD